jgi:Protein of unknown function, DUF417
MMFGAIGQAIAVSRPFEPPLLPGLQAIFMHQPRRSSSSHREAVILQLARHPRTAISAVRQCERGSNVCQQHHVIALTPTAWPIFPCKIATLTDAEHSAKTGALGSCVTFIMTVTIIPFMPNGWAASAGGFPAMAGNIPCLMKDVVFFAASVYLLKQDVLRVSVSDPEMTHPEMTLAYSSSGDSYASAGTD